jgi:ribosomal-protein-alanine N-acetyltransferase
MPELFEPGAHPSETTGQPIIHVPVLGALLRPWNRADGRHLSIALADDQIQRWNLQRADTLAEAWEWVDRWTQRWVERTGASWAVVRRCRPDVPLGQVGFRSLYLDDGLAEISCWVVPGIRRRRVGTEATRALAEWAYLTTELERLEIVHSVRNDISCSVALHAGFRIEGIKRSLQRHADGFHDMCLHSRIRADDGRPIAQADRFGPPANGVVYARERMHPDPRPPPPRLTWT